ncbi:hypothetical protein M0D69_18450 [Caballeronia sp. SEWSISQ10-4 2]|uniref:hypothetical protein n=1 Tax=Caballeronia sp. SEWSISQ10-4 2 TaxID=2937438 RepID=UPI00264C65C4|nr:hypothetical protein [Caballeronia sp. SEWSISQ10-4 2]MDN7179940.1 hypothetical protein [Caballeronia sp. SEWSISQ10-4 2]
MIRHPAHDITWILGDRRQFARHDVNAKNVEDLRIATIHLDQHVAVIVPEVIDNAGLDAIERRQIARLAAVDRNRKHVEVLVASQIFDKQNLVVALPCVAGHVAFCLVGQGVGLAYGSAISIDPLHEYVLAAGAPRKKGQVPAIRSDCERMLVWSAEEVSHRVPFDCATVTATLLLIFSDHACPHESCV